MTTNLFSPQGCSFMYLTGGTANVPYAPTDDVGGKSLVVTQANGATNVPTGTGQLHQSGGTSWITAGLTVGMTFFVIGMANNLSTVEHTVTAVVAADVTCTPALVNENTPPVGAVTVRVSSGSSIPIASTSKVALMSITVLDASTGGTITFYEDDGVTTIPGHVYTIANAQVCPLVIPCGGESGRNLKPWRVAVSNTGMKLLFDYNKVA